MTQLTKVGALLVVTCLLCGTMGLNTASEAKKVYTKRDDAHWFQNNRRNSNHDLRSPRADQTADDFQQAKEPRYPRRSPSADRHTSDTIRRRPNY